MNMNITKKDWLKYWPYDIKSKPPRHEQEVALNTVISGFVNDPNKQFAILDLPTGIGKSAIGIVIAKYFNDHEPNTPNYADKAYILTSQKMLQEQYCTDFQDIVSLKSKSNYKCHLSTADTCEDGAMVKDMFPEIKSKEEIACSSFCSYSNAVKEFVMAHYGITNYQFFFNGSATQLFKTGQTLILDECHLIEKEVWNYVEMEISQKFVESELRLKLPTEDIKVFPWVRNLLIPILSKQIEYLTTVADKLKANAEAEAYKEIKRKMKIYMNYVSGLQFICDDVDTNPLNYVIDFIEFNNKKTSETYNKISIKPVNINMLTDDLLFKKCKRTILMSATVGDMDYFMSNMGIDPDKAITLSMDSPFPVQNRPILFADIGSMGYKNIESTLPVLIDIVKDILNTHKNEKGIIFCNSYKIANYIKFNLRNPRLIFHDNDDRMDKLQSFMTDRSNKVFVAVAMSTGLDLKGDLARFGVVCKMPFPFLGDKQVQAKKLLDPTWYTYTTIQELIQTLGRSVRAYDDFAINYILDSDFQFLYSKNRKMFPKYIKDAIQMS